MKNNKKYKSCRDVTKDECYIGGKNCGTCMYRDNTRDKEGFRRSDYDSSDYYDWCTACKR